MLLCISRVSSVDAAVRMLWFMIRASSQPKNRSLQVLARPGVTTLPTLASSHNKSPASRVKAINRHLVSSARNSSSFHHTSPTSTTGMASQFKTRKIGRPNTLEHRIFIEKDGVPISPFHDIPLYANEQQTVLNMVVEIPRWTNGKMEVSRPHLHPMRPSTFLLQSPVLGLLTRLLLDF